MRSLSGSSQVEQAELLAFTAELLERLAIRYAIVGSLASAAWGEPRFTQDIDVIVQLSEEQLDPLLAALREDKFYVSRSAALDGIRLRRPFNAIHFSSGDKIDFMILGDAPWARAARPPAETGDCSRRVRLCRRARGRHHREAGQLSRRRFRRDGGSEKHLRDVAGMLRISGAEVDRGYVGQWAGQLAVTDIWREILRTVDGNASAAQCAGRRLQHAEPHCGPPVA